MSETTSSPSVNQHAISRSSSLSSTPPDSAPDSEPTSDEQPDLGAFTTVLREWTHLQPPPRIPIQIRSATSSTTPTYHAEQSVTGSEGRSRSGRSRNSRGTRSALSTLSYPTRPPSSSVHPDGSTVWAHAPIASYLFSGTPSLEQSQEREDEQDDDGYTPSPPDSRASTAMTVEIASEVESISFDDGVARSIPNRDDFSPDNASAIIPITVASETHRINSRETAHVVDELDSLSSRDRMDDSSLTSRDIIRPSFQDRAVTSSQISISDPSITTSLQLQSQARPVTTTFPSSSSSSLPLSLESSEDPGVSISIAGPSSASQINSVIGPVSTSSDSNSTLMNDYYLNQSHYPPPQRRMSDSSYTTNASASSFSLVSYQIPETPSILAPHEEESDQERSMERPQWLDAQHTNASSSALSTSGIGSLKTQPSFPSTSSSSLNSLNSMAPQGHISNTSLSSTGSPLPNPHSPLPTPESDVHHTLPLQVETARQMSFIGDDHASHRGVEIAIVDDSGTPDYPPSETVMFTFSAQRRVFEPVDDEEDPEPTPSYNPLGCQDHSPPAAAGPSTTNQDNDIREDISISSTQPSTKPRPVLHPYPSDESLDEDELDRTYRYPNSHSRTPRYPFAHTPRGIPEPSDTSRRMKYYMPPNSTSGTASFKHPSYTVTDRPRRPDDSNTSSTATAPFNSQIQPTDNMYSASTAINVPIEQPQDEDDFDDATRSPPSPFLKASIDKDTGAPFRPQDVGTSTTQQYTLYPSSSHASTQERPIQSFKHNALALNSSSSKPPDGPHLPHHDSPFSTTSQAISLLTQPYANSTQSLDQDLEYPHSLAGLHLLPTQPPRGAVVLESSISSSSAYSNETNRASEAGSPHAHEDDAGFLPDGGTGVNLSRPTVPDEDLELNEGLVDDAALIDGHGVLPSLGYLDEALSFIAAERARWTAAREGVATNGSRGRSLGRRTEEEDVEGKEVSKEGDDDWRNAIDPERGGEHPKRKRRRKRPTRASGGSGVDGFEAPPSTLAAATVEDSQVPTPGSSPKKRRSKSAAPSASSSSLRSRASEKSGTMTPGRRKLKGKEKEFLIPLPTFATRSTPSRTVDIDSDFDDGGRTPTASLVGGILSTPSSMLSSINLFGKKGKRVGRKEREREKSKFDASKPVKTDDSSVLRDHSGGGREVVVLSDDGNDIDADDVEPRDEEDEPEIVGENDSISNMSLLKPPRKRSRSRRRKAKDTVHVHTLAGITGVYKSHPASPKRDFLRENKLAVESDEGKIDNGRTIVQDADITQQSGSVEEREKKKRIRTKRSNKTLTRVRSYPDLKVEVEIQDSKLKQAGAQDDDGTTPNESTPAASTFKAYPNTLLDDSQRGRMLSLAQHLQEFFPEQRQDLRRVITRLEKVDSAPTNADNRSALGNSEGSGSGGSSLIKSSPIVIPDKKLRRPKKLGHARAASEGTIPGVSKAVVPSSSVYHPITDVEEEEETQVKIIDPRGRPPRKKDPLIHVFVDHSNILIGLLSHLKRHSPSKKSSNPSRRKPSPVVSNSTPTSGTQTRPDPALAFASVKSSTSRPLPVLPASSSSVSRKSLPVDTTGPRDHPIPLPSFATLSRSVPARSLALHKPTNHPGNSSDDAENRETANQGVTYSGPETDNPNLKDIGKTAELGPFSERKKPQKHLWHSALSLVLERGRPITRRVVVASSPLYQPMEPLESLGYELRVFVRVPDLGDGKDRERFKEKGSNKITNLAKSSQGTPIKGAKPSYDRRFSGSTSAEGGQPSPSGAVHPGTTNATAPVVRVKYREQGVDELLQLKLHQAIAATDLVPDGSTIVLATGDGNMGQFNEEGFLGPIRTALRRGWKVELYAWEDGLSRAWRREFGEGTEWGKRGMFRVIGMEDFAPWLVETPQWT